VAAPTKRASKDDESERALYLTVMGPDHYATHDLPVRGSVVVGRDDCSDIRLTDPDASRRHVRLHIGDDRLEVEDLASSNGTLVRESRLAAGQRVRVLPGEAISLGHTTLMIQRRKPRLAMRRLWPHGYFEGRLEEECERAPETGAKLGVLRVHILGEGPPDGYGAIADVLSRALRSSDVLAQFGPDDYEVLLIDTEPATATAVAGEVGRQLATEGISAKVATVLFPVDGRSAQALMARLSTAIHGPARGEGEPIIESEAMRRVFTMAQRAANSKISVLILGETGTGKEVLAASIHAMSPRARGPFVCINCGALTEALLESELFGHEKGAFTGAVTTKEGLLEAAAGGTVFLDEIGEMPLALQTRLLRVMETKEITRVGALRPRPVDVRFLAATNRDLEEEIARKTFREDLYYRLNGITLTIPPLRERVSEILPLALSFLKKLSAPLGRRPPQLSGEAVSLLRSYLWPGNIRELRNVLERALLLCDGDLLTPEHLPLEKMRIALPEGRDPGIRPVPEAAPPDPAVFGQFSRTKEWAHDIERERVLDALARCAGNQTRAAILLGISRRTLCERLRKYDIPRPRAFREGRVVNLVR
jgi:DNA-binding NtrC family response regulator